MRSVVLAAATAFAIGVAPTAFAATTPANPGVTLPAYQTVRLSNGATILLSREARRPSDCLHGHTPRRRAGRPCRKGRNGVHHHRPSGKRSRQENCRAVRRGGGQRRWSDGRRCRRRVPSPIRGEFLTRDTDLMIGLLSDMAPPSPPSLRTSSPSSAIATLTR